MTGCYFSRHEPYRMELTIVLNDITRQAVGILNKIAEARFDGQNTQYVNNLQPETDMCNDSNILNELFSDGIANIMRKIEPYVEGYEDETTGERTLNLVFPWNWKQAMRPVLETNIKSYLVQYIIAQWLEKVSISDAEYNIAKAEKLLRDIKGVCELRRGKVHRGFDTTY